MSLHEFGTEPIPSSQSQLTGLATLTAVNLSPYVQQPIPGDLLAHIVRRREKIPVVRSSTALAFMAQEMVSAEAVHNTVPKVSNQLGYGDVEIIYAPARIELEVPEIGGRRIGPVHATSEQYWSSSIAFGVSSFERDITFFLRDAAASTTEIAVWEGRREEDLKVNGLDGLRMVLDETIPDNQRRISAADCGALMLLAHNLPKLLIT